MKIINVVTGFGYYKDLQNRVIAKVQLPRGEHFLKNEFTYHEVIDQAALDNIHVWRDPSIVEAEANENKIMIKIRAMAIEALKTEGQLPADFIDPMQK